MKVNANKTQLIVFGTKAMLRNFPEVTIKFGTSLVSESRTVKNLGLVMDRFLTFDAHIDQLVGKCTGVLLALSHAKHSLPSDIIASLVTSLVVSHIRYCISIYGNYGLAQRHRIQKLVNLCARIVCAADVNTNIYLPTTYSLAGSMHNRLLRITGESAYN